MDRFLLGILVVTVVVSVETRSTCGRGQFLDPDSHMCEYCIMVCDHMEIQNTASKCNNNCPDFLSKTTSTTGSTWASSLPTPAGLKDVETTSRTNSPSSLAVVVPVVSIAAVVVILALSLYHRQRLHQMCLSVQCYCHTRRPVQVVDGGNGGPDDLPRPNEILMYDVTTMDRN
ncbi:uncharacterized protein LOC124259279 [Haliotis rubra]|uniref:uncharacterized protein LOC124259279 n=1 Tax=Haliotis rubra TaxID=36100 RepID=UPI001EE54A5C|nr:uncharacterized protein LOC124259279 [Haliotis rubra]